MAKRISKEEPSQEKTQKTQKTVKISKGYSRKVSLKGISSQYDNIEESLIVEFTIPFEKQEELDDYFDVISDLVRDRVEAEIVVSIRKLEERANDPSQRAEMGLGRSVRQIKEQTGDIAGFDELIEEDNKGLSSTTVKLRNAREIEL